MQRSVVASTAPVASPAASTEAVVSPVASMAEADAKAVVSTVVGKGGVAARTSQSHPA